MEIKDLTGQFIEYAEGRCRLSDYLKTHPVFFEHYLKFWGTSEPKFTELSSVQIKKNRDRVLKSIKKANEQLLKQKFELSELEIVLFVGQNTSNGHAFLNDGKPTVYIALECYTSDLYSDVFCMHEIIHGLHYQTQTELAFDSKLDKNQISRQLLTEGVATYLTGSILNISNSETLWADYLNDSQLSVWNKSFEKNLSTILDLCIQNYHSTEDILSGQLFEVSDIQNALNSRAGYQVGRLAVKSIVRSKNLTVEEVLAINQNDLLNALKNLYEKVF